MLRLKQSDTIMYIVQLCMHKHNQSINQMYLSTESTTLNLFKSLLDRIICVHESKNHKRRAIQERLLREEGSAWREKSLACRGGISVA
jgi:hypothetical protein